MGTSGNFRSPAPSFLLLVDGSRRQSVCDVLLGIEPGCRIQIAASPAAATSLLAAGAVHRLILDLQLPSIQPLSLIHHLARIAPGTAVLAFGETAARSALRPYEVRPWSELAPALTRALEQIAGAEADPSPPSPPQGDRS